MSKLFPDVETRVISIGLLLIFLWGINRCNEKKKEFSLQQTKEKTVIAAKRVLDTVVALTQPPLPAVATVVPPALPRQLPRTPADVMIPPPTPIANQQYGVTQPNLAIPVAPTTLPPPSATSAIAVPSTVVLPTLYVTIENLNLRTQPNVSGKLLGRLHVHEQVSFMNEVTPTTQRVVLANGEVANEPWIKIKTQKGIVGWVYGAGVSFYKKKR